MVSIDGLGAVNLEPLRKKGAVQTLERLRTSGLYTHEARTDISNTTTVPNHTSMLTGRPVSSGEGLNETDYHGYTLNVDPPPYATLHNGGNGALEYVSSVFDVAHDMGLSTCFFASKSKFIIFKNSYNDRNGAVDTIGADNGQNKIDIFNIDMDTSRLVEKMTAALDEGACDLTFLHLVDTDAAGHTFGWGSDEWNKSAKRVDALLGDVVDVIETSPELKNQTVVLVTADHGGTENNHADPNVREHYSVPFYVWGPGVPVGDLYKKLQKTHCHPGKGNPEYSDSPPPIRNGVIGNTALYLLGLPPVPGSVMSGLEIFDE